MGTQQVQTGQGGEAHRAFMRRLLVDLQALERMLEEDLFERGVTRFGAEQEIVLVDSHWRPAPKAVEILARIDDRRVTTEIGRFNLEFNLDPQVLGGSCLSDLEGAIGELLGKIQSIASDEGARALLTGILPTLQLTDLGTENITPRDRYFLLDRELARLRGGHYELQIKGADELHVRHPTVMLEALNTSFQVHYQVDPHLFAESYNLAQAVSAPVLAACCNSPILFGKRLWRETRIAIFQQTVDTRRDVPVERDTISRVRFGEGWVDRSVMEIYQNDVARLRLLLGGPVDEDPLAVLDAGGVPKLAALQTHNSTIYRWNRACYGVTGGRPHLRVECRLLPAGPSVIDEVANAALWLGVMHGGLEAWGNVARHMDFDDARANFMSAARQGLGAHLDWFEHRHIQADRLLLDEILPVSRAGLVRAGVDEEDIARCLGVIQQRIETRRTGAQWLLDSAAKMKGQGTRAGRLACLAAGTYRCQQTGKPVHEWEPVGLGECPDWLTGYLRVGQYMSTNLITVNEEELIDLVAAIMDWERVRHIPVEDDDHRLVGLVTYRRLIRMISDRRPNERGEPIAVRDVMARDPLTVTPQTTTLEAIRLMKEHKVSGLPVVSGERLVGLVTEHDLAEIARMLLEERLREFEPGQSGGAARSPGV